MWTTSRVASGAAAESKAVGSLESRINNRRRFAGMPDTTLTALLSALPAIIVALGTATATIIGAIRRRRGR